MNDPNLQMLKPNTLKGQKVLIVMLWTYELNKKKENPKIMPEFLFESGIINQKVDKKHPLVNQLCVEKAIKNLGGEIYVVMNYEDAIKQLLNSIKGKCPYYSVWLISSTNKCILPDKNSNPNYLNEFMNVLHLFSSKGGSVVLFGESDPLFFQANLFLEQHKFPTNRGLINTNLRLFGNHIGKQILTPDDTGELKKNSKFNSKGEIYNLQGEINNNNPVVERPCLGYNLTKIYEGETISYAKDSSDIYPFTKFAVDSEGGATILLYSGLYGHGDIIVDGGFTKCFLNMEEEGTFKYLQNLAAFTARIECNFNKVSRPKNINYSLKKVSKSIKIFYRMIFLIDGQIPFNFSKIRKDLQSRFYEGDVIYITNSKKYKANLEYINETEEFEPDFSVDNNRILNEINNFEEGLYNRIYIYDVGEQIKNDYKFSDLIYVCYNLKISIKKTHNSYMKKKYFLQNVQNILINVIDLNSFKNNFINIRNFLYNYYYDSDEEKKKLKKK